MSAELDPRRVPEAPRLGRSGALSLAAILAAFVVLRCGLHLGLTPFFDADTYKYIGAADALLAGDGLPPLFKDLPVTGGPLHAMPGYAWLLSWIWTIAGGIDFGSVLVVHALVSLVGYLLAADIVRRWCGTWPALALLACLTLSPSIAWLEHTVMPDCLSAPLFFMAAWAVTVPGFGGKPRWLRCAPGVLCGAGVGFLLLCQTSSQTHALALCGLAVVSIRPLGALFLWGAGFLLGLGLAVLPWVLHNGEVHGVYRLSASTGRNLYFSALWSDSLDRASSIRGLGRWLPADDVSTSFEIADHRIRSLLADGNSFAEMDEALFRLAVDAYRTGDWATIAGQRSRLVGGCFAAARDDDMGSLMRPLRTSIDYVLENPNYKVPMRKWAENRFKHPFSERLLAAMAEARVPKGSRSEGIFRSWTRALTFDGVPLLIAYLLALPGLLLLGSARAQAFWALASVPLLSLGVFAVFGAPQYRYQVVLHPFMLSTVIVTLAIAATRIRAPRIPSGGSR